MSGTCRRRRQLSTEEYVQGVLAGDRAILARTITLVESHSPAHRQREQEVLQHLLSHSGKSIRIGITGVPGVGKSTFIEALGCYLCEQEHRVAVLAIDPSSSLSRGSILGDKTRMGCLSQYENAFIRPSPAGRTLGGVARKTRETILVCEAGGFDVILIETVGVGQSEVTVRSMVDFMLLLMLAGAGDELQGIKKGVIELADALLVNKADGENKIRAETARQEYARALHYLAPVTEGWTTPVSSCSALTGKGIAEIWATIEDFRRKTQGSGMFAKRRQEQRCDWFHAMIEERLQTLFYHHSLVGEQLPQVEQAMLDERLPVATAVEKLFGVFSMENAPTHPDAILQKNNVMHKPDFAGQPKIS
jgi:LAO/AO transport system kinase